MAHGEAGSKSELEAEAEALDSGLSFPNELFLEVAEYLDRDLGRCSIWRGRVAACTAS